MSCCSQRAQSAVRVRSCGSAANRARIGIVSMCLSLILHCYLDNFSYICSLICMSTVRNGASVHCIVLLVDEQIGVCEMRAHTCARAMTLQAQLGWCDTDADQCCMVLIFALFFAAVLCSVQA
jgi:hypothetical protein